MLRPLLRPLVQKTSVNLCLLRRYDFPKDWDPPIGIQPVGSVRSLSHPRLSAPIRTHPHPSAPIHNIISPITIQKAVTAIDKSIPPKTAKNPVRPSTLRGGVRHLSGVCWKCIRALAQKQRLGARLCEMAIHTPGRFQALKVSSP